MTFLEPAEASLHNPAFWQNLEGVQLASLDDFNGRSNDIFDRVGKRLTHVAAIDQNVSDSRQACLGGGNHRHRTRLVADVGGRDVQGMRETVRVNRDMPFNTRDFLAGVVTLFRSRIRVLDGLCINNQKSGVRAATMVLSNLAN
jgi:hypothetical protein